MSGLIDSKELNTMIGENQSKGRLQEFNTSYRFDERSYGGNKESDQKRQAHHMKIGGFNPEKIGKIQNLLNSLEKPFGSSSIVLTGGQTSIRPYWRCYFPNTQAIIYVVDSSDTDRLVIAKEEFHAILEEDELKGSVVLVYANKQDLPGAVDDAAITEALELHKIKNRQWAIFKTSAIKGEGLFEGLDWLSTTLKSGGS